MDVRIFGKTKCGKCEATKKKVNHFITRWNLQDDIPVSFFNMGTVEGLAEAAFNDVGEVPTTIVRKGKCTLHRWEGEVPKTGEFRKFILDTPD